MAEYRIGKDWIVTAPIEVRGKELISYEGFPRNAILLYRINPPEFGWYKAWHNGEQVVVRLQSEGTKVWWNQELHDSVEFTLIERVVVNNQ